LESNHHLTLIFEKKKVWLFSYFCSSTGNQHNSSGDENILAFVQAVFLIIFTSKILLPLSLLEKKDLFIWPGFKEKKPPDILRFFPFLRF
jgi:hypothetical protein